MRSVDQQRLGIHSEFAGVLLGTRKVAFGQIDEVAVLETMEAPASSVRVKQRGKFGLGKVIQTDAVRLTRLD